MAIVDLPDGGFILRPNPGKMRFRKRVLGVVVTLFTAITLVLEVQVVLKFHQVVWTEALVPFVGIGMVLLLGWYVIKLPSLKVDAIKVSILDGLDTKRMSRSDLSFIFRGQLRRQVKGGSYWDKSYIFAGSDGAVWLSTWAEWFTEDGVVEFAQRLRLPIRGDFSVQVTDRVDPTGQSEPK